MIDRKILGKAQQDGVYKQLACLRHNIEYQQILCPACHATIHESRERSHFFPNYNINTAGNNVKVAMEMQVRVRSKKWEPHTQRNYNAPEK
jgi:hypothetical protein